MNIDDALNRLRRANDCLEKFFARFSGAPVLGTNEEVEALLQVEGALRSVRPLLRPSLEASQERQIQTEVVRYRANLLRLQRELAVMQDSASGTRARLFARQSHLQAARAWCAATRAAGE